tara:strand:+ start:61757 stop:62596 length:840 start_codon:yes stop_codon:yes gene_type:complete
MKNILLPTDFSENSWNAILYAINFYENETCTFYLLHVEGFGSMVTDTPYIPESIAFEGDFINPAKIKLKQILKRISHTFSSNKKHKFYLLAEYNYLVDAVKKYVKEKKIDLIVMGTKGASGIKEKIIGSNTGNVITKISCTTLVVPKKAKFKIPKEIVFPTDFIQNFTFHLLQPIINIIKKKGSSLRIVHITKQNTLLSTEQQQNKHLLKDAFQNYNCSFHNLSTKKVEEAVLFFAEDRGIDLIVMVAKNVNYFQHLFFQSRAEKISFHTNLPFLILHE